MDLNLENTLRGIMWIYLWIPGLLAEENNTSPVSVHFRLVRQVSRCNGDLEMKLQGGNWKPVNGYRWNKKLGNRVCAELDCGSAVSLKQRRNYSEIDSWFIKENCDKPHLRKCFKSKLILHTYLELNCSGLLAEENNTSPVSVHFRLVRQISRCNGDLEMKLQGGNWKPVNGKTWNKKLGNRVCAELDCGSVVSLKQRLKYSEIDSWFIKENCDKPHLSNCFTPEPNLLASLELSCSDTVKLVNGSSLCSGRLEVWSDQSRSWSSVCEGHLDLDDAQVVCRELGCGSPKSFQGALSVIKTFQCEGHESTLLNCGNFGPQNCSSGTAVNLTCTDPEYVRLVEGASRCTGHVEIKSHGQWRNLAYISSDLWTLKAADVICRQLDCGSAVSGESSGFLDSVWYINPTCLLSTSSVKDCESSETSYKSWHLFLTCSDSVRLVNGPSWCSGRLQVHTNQSWSSVCEDVLDLNDATVVCRELGCGTPLLHQGGRYEEGEVPVWTNELQCKGNESTLLDCGKSSSAGKNCTNGTAAGLTCTGGARLVGQPSRCAGTLEIQNQGEWKPIEATSNDWNLKIASTVCQQLNCGSAVIVNATDRYIERPVWFFSVQCINLTSQLKDCVTLDDSYEKPTGVEVVCSDLLPQPNISLSDGVFEAYQQGFRVLVGSDFTITCSVQPRYPGGFFQLISNTKKSLNLTLPAVNHSAHFLLSNMGRPHRGNYVCVYHVKVYNHTFSSSQSPALYLTIADLVRNLIIRVVLIVLALLIFDICIFYFYKVSMKRIHENGRH